MENNSGSPKQDLAAKLKGANNVLVTVSNNPRVDQLAACIGLTLWLNKLGKHATAVFSGEVPSTVEFLEPAATLEKNTDSLRDFIIALDKSKADKLRYKVEDRVVKIFITPYRTSLSADDLEFSQGDFNVDVVVALGVHEQNDLDAAITAHGRILHDAVVTTINTTPDGGLGSINWHDTQASSLCELVVDLGNELARDQLDAQIATALLTGIVAETARFSNEKTTPQTMSVSAELMTAGANQQLVATKLEAPVVPADPASEPEQPHDDTPSDSPPAQSADGSLEIAHEDDEAGVPDELKLPEPVDAPQETPESQEPEAEEPPESAPPSATKGSRLVVEPPMLGGRLTANTEPEAYSPSTDPLSRATFGGEQPLLSRSKDDRQPEKEPPKLQPAPPDWEPPAVDEPEETPAEAAAEVPAPAEPAPESEPPSTPDPAAEPEQPEAAPKEAPVEPESPAPASTEPVAEPAEPEAAPAEVPASTEEAPAQEAAPTELADVPKTPDSEPAPAAEPVSDPADTLSDIEASVHSPHLRDQQTDLYAARSEVLKALGSEPPAPEPIQALNAQPLGEALHPAEEPAAAESEASASEPEAAPAAPDKPAGDPPADKPVEEKIVQFDPAAFGAINDEDPAAPAPKPLQIEGVTAPETVLPDPGKPASPTQPEVINPTAPPPVPPPLPYQFDGSKPKEPPASANDIPL